MGRSDNNISFGKTRPTMHIPAAQLRSSTLPAEHPQRQNIPPLLLSDQLRSNTAMHSREYFPPGPPPRYYAQSRDVFTRSGVVDDSSAYSSAGVGSPAHFPGDIMNRDFLIEYSTRPPRDTAFQSPVMVVPSYRTNATSQSYEGNASHASRVQNAVSPSVVGVGTSANSSVDSRYRLDVGPPAQVSNGNPDRTPTVTNPVLSRPDTVFQPFPPYEREAIARRYEGDVGHVSQSQTAETSRSTVVYDPAYRHFNHSPYDLASPHPPLQLPPSIPASRTETPHPAPLADLTVQAVSFREHGAQQSGSPGVFLVDGCLIDGDDLPDQGTNDGSITIGECLRKDSPCSLWVKADRGSIKRHAQKWHGVARGGDTNKVSCTWAGCDTEMQKSAVPRHTLCKHFHEIFQCNGCSRLFTRGYFWRSHAEKCALSGCGYSVRYSPSTRSINVKGMSLRQVGH